MCSLHERMQRKFLRRNVTVCLRCAWSHVDIQLLPGRQSLDLALETKRESERTGWRKRGVHGGGGNGRKFVGREGKERRGEKSKPSPEGVDQC